MMEKLLPLVFILLAIYMRCSSAVNYGTGPAFCKGLDCPKFSEILKEEGYEERLYKAAKWVSTQILNLEYQPAVQEGFDKLFNYIQGNNVPEKEIPMTTPVTTRVIAGQGPTCENNFTVSFFVPFVYQSDPPQPTDPTVYISTFPQHRAYVRSFGGIATQDDWITNAATLAALLNASQTYDNTYFYTAAYDNPLTATSRHNEVWFIAD